MAKAGADRARSRLVKAQSWLRQDDCGGSALMMQWLEYRDGGTGQPRARRRRQWGLQGTAAAGLLVQGTKGRG